MNPLVASVIRTYTPIIVGQIGAWLIMANVPVQPELTVLLTAMVGGGLSLAYFTVVRVFEQQWPNVGILLGLPKSPDTYSKGDPAAVKPELLTEAAPVTVPVETPAPVEVVTPAPAPAPEAAPAPAA